MAAILSIDRNDILDHQWVDNGPGWLAVRLTSAQQVLDVDADPGRLGELMLGVVEDPVTGSRNAGVASG